MNDNSFNEEKNPLYESKVTIRSSYGNYKWCGVYGNFYLCNIENIDDTKKNMIEENIDYGENKKNMIEENIDYGENKKNMIEENIDYGENKKNMIEINIVMNDKLYNDVEFIFIYDSSGFCANYNTSNLPQNYTTRFILNYVKTGALLHICYKKKLPSEIINMGKYNISKPSFKCIHKDIITIPHIEIKSSEDCSVCIEKIKDNDRYISSCHHTFHINCIYEYTKHLNKTRLINECKKYCEKGIFKHSDQILEFSCPICKTILEHK